MFQILRGTEMKADDKFVMEYKKILLLRLSP